MSVCVCSSWSGNESEVSILKNHMMLCNQKGFSGSLEEVLNRRKKHELGLGSNCLLRSLLDVWESLGSLLQRAVSSAPMKPVRQTAVSVFQYLNIKFS